MIKQYARGSLAALLLSAGLVAACVPTDPQAGEVEVFNIAAHETDCVGVGPRQCLIVNDELFYDSIEGYQHVEGQAARVCVEKTKRPEPIPADASSLIYRQVPCKS